MPLKIAQEKFLTNSKNKSRFLEMLKITLSENNIFTCQAESDADNLIVETAINLQSANVFVFVVSEDIDVLVLLTALTPID